MATDSPLLGNTAKFSSTAASRQIMRYYLQNQSRTLLPTERVAQCHRAMAPLQTRVHIMQDPDAKRAYYRNLIICARIWQCPVCASKITEARKLEIQQGMANIVERSVLITYTLQHSKNDKLSVILEALLSAYGRMKSGRYWQTFVNDFSWIGSIRALEITYGRNGWHPHFHELAFVDPSLELADFDEMERRLRERWIKCLKEYSQDASWENGLQVQPTFSDAAEYVEKFGHDPVVDETWSAARELAKAPSKAASSKGRTPLGLLYDAAQGSDTAGALFVQYVDCFRGKHQLQWSKGLRDYMRLEAQTDEEAAEKIPDNVRLLAVLSDEQWRVILRKDKRGELLEIAAKGDSEELWEWLHDLGVTLTVEVNATDYMWEQVDKSAKSS